MKKWTLLTGPTGCGKSTLAEIICDHLADAATPSTNRFPVVDWQDTSFCIEHGRKRGDELGRRLNAEARKKESGLMIDARPAYDAVSSYVDELPGSKVLLNFLVAGSTRAVEESRIWKESGRIFRLVHIQCTETQVRKSIQDRMRTQNRPDDDGKTVATKLGEYRTKVLPAVSFLETQGEGNVVIHIHREEPLIKRVKAVVQHMLLPDDVKARMLDRLNDHRHPVHKAILEVESGRPLPKPIRLAKETPARKFIPAFA